MSKISRRLKVTEPHGMVVNGAFECGVGECHEMATEARLDQVAGKLRWLCPNKHQNEIPF